VRFIFVREVAKFRDARFLNNANTITFLTGVTNLCFRMAQWNLQMVRIISWSYNVGSTSLEREFS
jgi:hypothetical protein